MPVNLRGRHLLSLRHHTADEIRYLLDDPTYAAAYVAALRETAAIFDAPALIAKYQGLAAAIAPVAAAETSQAEYDAAVKTLTERITKRAADLETFLASQ